MPTVKQIEYEDASPEVKAIFDDIMATRNVDWINNVWKALAVNPSLMKNIWEGIKEATKPGALDALTKEMIYLAVSITKGCNYCVNSHTTAARKKGMTDEMHAELLAIVGMANQTAALANGLDLDLDEPFQKRRLGTQIILKKTWISRAGPLNRPSTKETFVFSKQKLPPDRLRLSGGSIYGPIVQ